MGEDSEYKGDYMLGDMPWVWVVRLIYWTHKSWGLTQGRETPLAGCRAMWTNKRSVEACTSPSRSMCSGACSQATMKRTDWDHICGCLFSLQSPTTIHALLASCGQSALEQCLPWRGRELGCGKQRCIWPRAASGWESQGHPQGGHLHRQCIRRSPDLWWRPDCHSRWPSMCPEPMRSSPAQ